MARMSRLLGAACLGAAATAAIATVAVTREYAPAHRSPAHAEPASRGRVIVKLKTRTGTLSVATAGGRGGPQAAAALGARLGLALADGRVLDERTQVLHAQGMDSAALAAALARDADVEWVQVDQRRYIQAAPVDDPLYPGGLTATATTPAAGQWYLHAPDAGAEDASGTLNISGIDVEPAWAITHGAAGVVIADVDTGLTAHPDITGSAPGAAGSKVFAATFSGTAASTPYGYDFIGYAAGTAGYTSTEGLQTANDGSLVDPDPSDPGDWITAPEDAGTVDGGEFQGCGRQDSSWHGTQTAGLLAAATNNGVGMAGAAYDTMLVPVRALGKCGGFDSDIIAAIEWAGGVLSDTSVPANTHVARVVNMSLGGSGTCGAAYVSALTRLRNAGVVVVAAAGNDDGLAVEVPANCKPAVTDPDQTPVVIAVAALRHAGDKVGFSDLGPEVTVAAPGGNCGDASASAPCLYPILSTSNAGTTSPGAAAYSTGYGTSFSTPMVSGTVALMLAANPALTNQQVINIVKSTARPFPIAGGTAATPACAAPTGTTQDECYCTKATCGAGMLDAGRAVAAAVVGGAPTAAVAAASSVAIGATTTLNASSSTGSNGSSIVSYQWSVASGAEDVTLGGTSGASVTATGAAIGTAQVIVTATDANGLQASTATTLAVTAASTGSSGGGSGGSTGGSGTSSGGGGGAANPAWLVALAIAGALLSPRRRGPRA
jgi:serine protease